MEHIATSPEFGPFTTALICCAAISLASGGTFAIIGVHQRSHPEYLSFSGLCLAVAAGAISIVFLNQAQDTASASLALRAVYASTALWFPPFFVFIGHFTRKPMKQQLLWPLSLTTMGFGVAFLLVPGGAPLTGLHALPPLVMPWGEQLAHFEGRPTVWVWIFEALIYAIAAWAVWRAVQLYRSGKPHSGQRLFGALLCICLCVLIATVIWGTIMIDVLHEAFPRVAPFAFLPFVLLMGFSLALGLQQRTERFNEMTQQLQSESRNRREVEDQLHHLAYHDTLTNLPNWAHTQIHLAELMQEIPTEHNRGVFMHFGLDNFKTINNTLGHRLGDVLLAQLAERLRAVAPPDAHVSRLDGDEFAVVSLHNADGTPEQALQHARHLAESIAANLAAPLHVEGRTLAVSASVGVSLFPDVDSDAADIMRRADIAMNRAKDAGRNVVRVFQAHMQSDADTRMELERGLHAAIRNEEFSLVFQPQTTHAGALVGAEVLLRWTHPRLGNVPPDTFIPIAESAGLMHDIGAWVVRAACRQISVWDREGIHFGQRLSVNVSPWQLSHPSFVETVDAQVKASGADASRLTLELTESALLHDFDLSLNTLRRLSELGFQLSLDDFGTGYSSLAYLQKLPLHEIKIDRTFVSALREDAPSPLAGFIVDVAKRLNMRVIAEGVETPEQRASLKTLGCDTLQGYLICRPKPAHEFALWLKTRAPGMTPGTSRHSGSVSQQRMYSTSPPMSRV